MKQKLFALLFIFSLLVFGCQKANITETPVISLPTEIEILITALPPASIPETPISSPTQPILPTVIPTISNQITLSNLTEIASIPPDCIEIDNNINFPNIQYEQFTGTLLAYLNQGGNPVGISNFIANNNIVNEYDESFWIGDLTANGKDDIVLSLQDSQKQSIPPSGVFLIIICNDNQYQLGKIIVPETPEGVGKIVYVQDIDNDYIPEVISSNSFCGAHTCFEQINIHSWNGNEFIERFSGTSTDLPFPQMKLIDFDGNGIFDLEITSNGFGSAGAGPQRQRTKIWTIDDIGNNWAFSQELLSQSKYRIHMFHDAETAFSQADYQVALVLYEVVISEDTLSDWISPETERQHIRTYARFKQIVAYSYLENITLANAMLNKIIEDVSQNDVRFPMVQLAQLFYDELITNGLDSACSTAIQYANDNHQAILGPLGSNTYGYAQQEILAESICLGS
jgi:hypothetical protein